MSNKPAFGTWLEKEVSRVTGKTYGNSGEGLSLFMSIWVCSEGCRPRLLPLESPAPAAKPWKYI